MNENLYNNLNISEVTIRISSDYFTILQVSKKLVEGIK